MSQTEYIPGTCNIGGGELTRRRMVAVLGLILTLSSAATLISTEASRQNRLGIFLPALVMSVGWESVRSEILQNASRAIANVDVTWRNE